MMATVLGTAGEVYFTAGSGTQLLECAFLNVCGPRSRVVVSTSDGRDLAWLRDETGDAFTTGIILHTGPHVFPVSERILAAPVATLWSPAR